MDRCHLQIIECKQFWTHTWDRFQYCCADCQEVNVLLRELADRHDIWYHRPTFIFRRRKCVLKANIWIAFARRRLWKQNEECSLNIYIYIYIYIYFLFNLLEFHYLRTILDLSSAIPSEYACYKWFQRYFSFSQQSTYINAQNMKNILKP
jgi:hypothetical protein